MKCPNCNNDMKYVMHFEHRKAFAFHKCENCSIKTHRKRIHFNELKVTKNKEIKWGF